MLIEFTLENFGVYRDRASINLIKNSGDEHPENVLECRAVKNGVLNGAVIYGNNGSGKTTLIRAMNQIRCIAMGKEPICNKFRGRNDTPTEMSIRFTDDIEVLFEYNVKFSENIISESASFSPNGRITRIFTRNGCNIDAGSKFQDLNNLEAEDNISFLYTAAENGNEVCARMQDWFSHCILVAPEYSDERFLTLMKIFNRNPELKADLIMTMRSAGYSIKDLSENEIFYRYADSNEEYTIPYTKESQGTLNTIFTFYTMYLALKKGCTLISDNLGGWITPEVFQYIIKQFSAESNPSKAQLLTVRPDRLMMSTEILRRDQILINIRDDRTGESTLHAVSEFKGIRANTDVRKEFENGRFDYIPEENGTTPIDPE